jgi:hypothetical protein
MIKKIKKEQPRYKTQKQYEFEFKRNYAKMLVAMSKEIIHTLTQDSNEK